MNKQENLEQTRILWIVLSALTVIAIVIAAGLFFFFPSEDGTIGQPQLSSLSNERQGRDFDPVGYVRNADGYPEMVTPQDTEEAFSVDSSSEEEAMTEGSEETAAANAEEEAESSEPEEEAPNVVEVTPARTEPEKTETPAASPVKQVQETRKISVTVYWIQVGSYTDLTKAEEVRSLLLGRDVSSEIQTRAVDGTTYYRVRIGAFQSKGEADKFLGPIKELDNFEESYVVQTTMIREVPVN